MNPASILKILKINNVNVGVVTEQDGYHKRIHDTRPFDWNAFSCNHRESNVVGEYDDDQA